LADVVPWQPKNGQFRAFDALRRAKGGTPGSLLDIAPETAVKRKAVDRDRYERDLAMQHRVRDSYRRQAEGGGWIVLDGERPPAAIAADVVSAVAPRLGPP
jgi:thymidylate kinase